MKVLVFLGLCGLALSGPTLLQNDNEPVVPNEAIFAINNQQSQWTASKDWVGEMTVAEAKRFAATTIKPREFPERNWGALAEYTSVPDNFDSRKKWPNCIHPILNQGQCGSCWAFGAAEALSDRFCIDSNGNDNVVLSPQYLVNCDTGSYGCDGGFPDQAWQFMTNYGIASMGCVSYHAKDGQCPSHCDNGQPIKLYYAENPETYSGPESIQRAILEGGPVETAFTVYQDFYSYSGGIYKHTWGGVVGGHAVKIVGWGVQNGTKYWIIANSWGASWGMDGFFWIEFGQCGIDKQAVAGRAKTY
mmetsp:Transcript_5055/g.7630  ORF Transcript_5055/g.7630 Transcript_5055/m.7630 type:complete len:303 (+) Transcript_5055:26-934(+)|eukprot:CAMPEP_0202427616 /NCGR_PEP_ID=MMETSP1345-20130828/1785_1 /ASSEMBLY_ACC=CAM_ASM_000843 /TAXON_ID=342563 /ORGANISM="Fabrea Fabrea salina" /LENGTH=302 /DNA_ID=CAMNT_0049038377 /DNA_START=11 /DNA_END=919 /DNA_ORIENTATION=-